MNQIYIIGVGIEGISSLSQRALRLIENASILIGGRRHLAYFPDFKGRKVVIGPNLDEVVKVLTHHSPLTTHHSPVVLASGDPNFFGIANLLIKKLGKDNIEIIPNVTVMQSAFAMIKEGWGDARFFSVHGKNRGQGKDAFKGIVDEIVCHDKVGIFTDPHNTPSRIARTLLDRGIKGYRVYVCEDLGTEMEKATAGTLAQIARRRFSQLNVMVLIRQGSRKDKPPNPRTLDPSTTVFGIPDSEFSHPRGMITKEEVRVISLSKLKLIREGILWDIGAGCGSISISAGLFMDKGKVYAVEKDERMVTYIRRNINRFGATNVDVISQEAPGGLKGLPSPDAIFIGGGGGRLDGILQVCSRRIKRGGRLVLNAVTLETLTRGANFFKRIGWIWETTSIHVTKTSRMVDPHIFNAYNPVFIIVGEKPVR